MWPTVKLRTCSKPNSQTRNPKPRKPSQTMPDELKLTTMVVLGSSRQGRMGDRVGKFLLDQLRNHRKQVEHVIDYVDLAELQLEFMVQAVHYHSSPALIPPHIAALEKRIARADAFVFISPEYNHSMSPVLANFINHFPPTALAGKPSAIAVYSMGPFGGVRAAMQMRSMLGVLAIPISSILAVPEVQHSLDPDGKPVGPFASSLESQANKLLGELEWYGEATKVQRGKRLL
ncbi:hypothetical protein BASA81_008889 [Batrachochytrium salamandrivorans]|nr:hypothetical protein BASA81_008889 [Batrachochytrium salamandrivorans]